ncbi:DsbC family protein [Pseudorhodoferax sp. Leaf267]|uniref:DsbC family protein n=1 Tax=Pseudorhodoferax sp. Leaf267 TaxID=1736316 RepID=UPI0006F62645|nr:DsbC family protein [Pseudorhodoferax sp. Leaf267]KQP20638.1 disulfide isomerase [Pseudorhodoferax sp. Leaf267]
MPAAAPVATSAASADPIAAIRKNLAERLPQLPPIEEITPAPMAGLYEVRLQGADIVYTDAEGNYLIQGQVFDTKLRRNLTEERIDKLTAIDFKSLPLKDSFKLVRGDGKRTLAVFVDPNCGYCKRFERDLEKIDNVTIHLFLYPILGADSVAKSQSIWCAKDKAKVWSDWMVRDQAIPSAQCDGAPVARNVEFGRKHKITGTPTLLFANGTRVPGALPAAEVEKLLVAAAGSTKP